MLKKLMLITLLVMSLGSASAFAATTVNPPYAVGTYNDFGIGIRLDINPKYSNAAQFKVLYGKGYNVKSGFQSFGVSATPNYRDYRYQYIARTEIQATSYGWWTVEVCSIASDGTTSKPFVTNVYVLR